MRRRWRTGTHNPKVAGSNPAPAIRKPPLARGFSCLREPVRIVALRPRSSSGRRGTRLARWHLCLYIRALAASHRADELRKPSIVADELRGEHRVRAQWRELADDRR